MKLVALVPCRNEQWALGLSARAMLRWCDGLVILDHASTDATPAIITELASEYPGRVAAIRVDDPDWNEAIYRQALLEEGRRRGGTHWAIIDADEILSGNLLGEVRGMAESLSPGQLLRLPWRCCWRSIDRYRVNDGSVWAMATVPCLMADGPGVRWSAGPGGYQIHTRVPAGANQQQISCDGGVMHLQFVQWERLLAKQALYKMQEVLRWPGRKSTATINTQYGQAVDETGINLDAVPAVWWEPYRPLMSRLDVADVPWQAEECRRLWTEHGAARFAGLELWGVA